MRNYDLPRLLVCLAVVLFSTSCSNEAARQTDTVGGGGVGTTPPTAGARDAQGSGTPSPAAQEIRDVFEFEGQCNAAIDFSTIDLTPTAEEASAELENTFQIPRSLIPIALAVRERIRAVRAAEGDLAVGSTSELQRKASACSAAGKAFSEGAPLEQQIAAATMAFESTRG